jgi:dienelactone hydrolase
MTLPAVSDRHLAVPSEPCGAGVLVLAGSSGRVERERAEMLAAHGARALSIRWFGGEGQRPTPHEVPLETFFAALDVLQRDCDRVSVVGASFGAEAALLTAVEDGRVGAVVALAPTSVAWAGHGEGGWSSHWTLGEQPVPYVPFDPDWTPSSDPPSFRGLYERSLAADPALTSAAAIRVEKIVGDVVLVAGEDDQVWPSADSMRDIAHRRASHGLATRTIIHGRAGHRVVLPGEVPQSGGMAMARGGTPEADSALGRAAWPAIAEALRLRTSSDSDR